MLLAASAPRNASLAELFTYGLLFEKQWIASSLSAHLPCTILVLYVDAARRIQLRNLNTYPTFTLTPTKMQW